MNVSKFYGSSTATRVLEDGNVSEDPDFQDDETFSAGKKLRNELCILCSESGSDDVGPKNYNTRHKRTVIPESESETDVDRDYACL